MDSARPDPAVIDPRSLRRTLAGFATGVAVVAAEVDGRVVGLLMNSFTSVSLDPPLVSLAFDPRSATWSTLRGAGRWGLSVLGEHQDELLTAMRRPAAERFSGIDVDVDATNGAALVPGALAHLTVELDAEVTAGDHVLTLLRVLDHTRDAAQRPLVFFDSTTHHLFPTTPSPTSRSTT